MRPRLKVLYTSGQAVTDGMAALFVNNSAFLPKPYTVKQLGTMLGLKFDFRSQPGLMQAMATEPTEFTPVNIRIADPIPVFQRSLLTGRQFLSERRPLFVRRKE